MRLYQTNTVRPPRRGNPPLLIPLDRRADTPLFRQVYRAIRDGILSGRLAGLRAIVGT